MINSPLRYPGGKSKAIKYISPYIPTDCIEYREPFFGGGSTAIYIKQNFSNYQTIKVSDLNYDLYCFWNQLKLNGDYVIGHIQEIYDDYKKIDNGRELYKMLLNRRNLHYTEIGKAIDFFILNRITFSGLLDSGGYSDKAFKGRFTQSSIDRLRLMPSLIKDFAIYNYDYEVLLNNEGDNVFIYLDPPYYSAMKSKLYGKKGDLHTGFDHIKLRDILMDINHKWLLSYDNSDYIQNLYKDFNIREYRLHYGMSSNNSDKSNELLISNYNI